ncbi:thiamine biosynthesis protein ThiW [Pontibacillus chungwhensis BH030062]|uniref:Thiamine biosynthesis protein ThiW n=1 Tax=Pontibacillus chungwhensis BH030062 TaxID=1385513 RepID=A0A0A2V0D3_9BACI|nr:energy coupling factor transporter S component ThiW [Pontibacillus chungwhensis]KGP92261.1 thiamine biosynthesis protein ThiW [Pontibacillus chungwhensis BH030062]
MNKTRMITTMAIFVAIGTLGAQVLWFPAGIAKAYPVQHVVNVLAAVTLGPLPAVAIAFVIGILRVLLGLGTLLAFPGGMIGALLAGIFYKISKRKGLAVVGEVLGTGVIGALFAVPYAQLFMGTSVGALAFLPPFFVSSVSGAFLGWFVLSRVGERLSVRRV